jgi:hypothetical protein
VNLTMPPATWLGLSDAPCHAAGYGPLDAGDSRDLAARLAGQRGSHWCITLTGEGGRPVAHGCAPHRPRAVRALPATTGTLTGKPGISPPRRQFPGLADRRQRMAGRDHHLQAGDG